MEAQETQLLNKGLTEQWWQVRGQGCLCLATAAPSSLEATFGVWAQRGVGGLGAFISEFCSLEGRGDWAGEGEQMDN
jgi:hypothetical protein